MKRHYIYFIIIPVALAFALWLPFVRVQWPDEEPMIINAYKNPSGIIFLGAAVLGSVLLLLKNQLSAILGLVLYILGLAFAVFTFFIIESMPDGDTGPGHYLTVLVFLIAAVLGAVQTVRMYRLNREMSKLSDSSELLDN